VAKALPAYSSRYSPRKFTQHQHVAILEVREFFGLGYRGVGQLLHEWSDLRDVLGLKAVPPTKYRRQMKRRFFERVYGQRRQIEHVQLAQAEARIRDCDLSEKMPARPRTSSCGILSRR